MSDSISVCIYMRAFGSEGTHRALRLGGGTRPGSGQDVVSCAMWPAVCVLFFSFFLFFQE